MKVLYTDDINLKEFIIHLCSVLAVSVLMFGITYLSLYASLEDTEILNGKVLSKYNHTEICTQYSSCEHYVLRERCETVTTSKGKTKESCTSYKVFDYPYEVDWYVKSTLDTYKIKRVNPQGTVVPDRWQVVNIGDPVSTSQWYINYLLGNKESLFHLQEFNTKYSDEYKKTLPDYPEIYDYYKVNHVINLTSTSSVNYNDYISLALRDMGADKQVNIVLVMYDYKNTDFVDATILKWKGGKKNDVIMFFGLDESGVIKNFRSTSFAGGSGNELLHSTLKMDNISETMSIEVVQKSVQDVEKYFKRMRNSEFKYLMYKLEPSTSVVVFCMLLSLVISILLGSYMRKVDL